MTRTLEKSLRVKSLAGDDARWAAVVARDRTVDGKFYYSVASTGVYCRPSCPARLAKRANVNFHTTRADAEAAGFRPCKRCRPDQPALDEQYASKVAEACRLIEEAEEEPKLDELAQIVGLSPYHFHRIFKSVAGVTPKAYAIAHRQKRVREKLERSKSVTEAIYDAGFNSSGRFYATSSQVLGMTPSNFRAGGTSAELKFAIGECSLGSILVAASKKGVCAILLGEDPEVLVRDLQDRFPQAQMIDWKALRDIPYGSTASYVDIAKRIGNPKAVRAVAQACAANPVAVAIPCHRVVRNDGALSGYRWGVEHKRALLDREAKS